MENSFINHLSESQHAFYVGLRLLGLYLKPVDFELIWGLQKHINATGDLTLKEICELETQIRGKYESDGITIKSIPEMPQQNESAGMGMIEALRLAIEKDEWACLTPGGVKIKYSKSGLLMDEDGDSPNLTQEEIESTEWTVGD